jgi:hypothetical protein
MQSSIRSVLTTALAMCAFAALGVAQASAATIEAGTTALQAIYGNPGTNGANVPVGGGLGRNFGFGENMLFQACSGCTTAVGENLKIEVNTTIAEARDSFIGGRLMSNKTGANNPLSFKIEFVDFQDSLLSGTLTQSYADTSDRPWISEICSPAAAANACKVDGQFAGAAKGAVKIDDVSFELSTAGGPIVVQGAAWGTWEDGAAAKAPCIKLEKPAAANPTLVVTQTFPGGPLLGAAVTKVEGKACLVSANNNWYVVGATKEEPAITIANT